MKKFIDRLNEMRKVYPEMTLNMAAVFMHIAHASSPPTISEIARGLDLRVPSCSRTVAKLTERGTQGIALGLVHTYNDAIDARLKRAELTPLGQQLAERIAAIGRRAA